MHPSYVAIDEEVLKRLYVEDRLSTDEIALRVGCTGTTILRRLRRFGITVRRKGPAPRRHEAAQPVTWNPEIAYAVGLIATDGNLVRHRHQMSVASKDVDLLETLRVCLRLTARIAAYRGGSGKLCHRIQWQDSVLYRWLLSIGLTPAKSLTLGPLAIPDEYFPDFFRGCIDGDGTVLVYTDRYHVAKNERYVYERLYVSLISASRPFIDWIQAEVRRLAGVRGVVEEKRNSGYNSCWLLRYAKRESIRVLGWMYYAPTVPCLARKRTAAERFLGVLGCASKRGVGRPRVGWQYAVQ